MKLEPVFRVQPGWLYLAPVLDAGFLLGLFFLFQGVFLLQPGIAVDVPRSPFLLAPQADPRVLSITGPPVPGFFYDNRAVRLGELAERWGADPASKPGTLIIKADTGAPYDLVLRAAVAAQEAGIPVVLATDDRPPSGISTP